MASEMMNFEGFTPDTRVSILTDEQSVGLSVNDVLKWIEPAAPPKEALKFLLTCRAAKLNPFLGEAYLVKMGDKWGTIIAKAGYLKRAQERPDFDGFEAGVVVQEQARDRVGNLLPGQRTGGLLEWDGEIVPPGYFLMGGWAKVYRKGISRPFKSRVSYTEYAKTGSPTWKQYPGTMIVKVALTHAIKEAYGIGDSYDEAESHDVRPQRSPGQADELRRVMEARVVQGSGTLGIAALGGPLDNPYAGVSDPTLPAEMVDKLLELKGKIGIEDDQWTGILLKGGVDHVARLSIMQAQALIRKLEGVASRPDFYDALPGVAKGEAPANFPHAKPLDQEIVRETKGDDTMDDGAGELVGAGIAGDTPPGYSPLPVHDIEG